jgi:hypothetical protein
MYKYNCFRGSTFNGLADNVNNGDLEAVKLGKEKRLA